MAFNPLFLLAGLQLWLSLAVYSIPLAPSHTLHRRSYFYVGQTYVPSGASSIGNSTIADGQMYVEHLVPAKTTQPFPIVIIHGHAMTGTNFLNTPDGRPGWADYFLSKGYELYIVDQPARGRSAWQRDVDGDQDVYDTLSVEIRFTATQRFKVWPQASLHTQWPGNGSVGDATFDHFYASTVPSISSEAESSMKIRQAGSALLDQIGPAVVMTHSQSGPYGWIIGDARPSLVKGIVAVEPTGPPFENAIFPPAGLARPWGLTVTPIAYSPPASSPDDLKRVIVDSNPALNYTCFQQARPARKLANLSNIPVLMVTSESGYHSVYDGCTAAYLSQAGVSVEHTRLKDVGIKGNGHMMFMEKNNMDIVDQVVEPWISKVSRK